MIVGSQLFTLGWGRFFPKAAPFFHRVLSQTGNPPGPARPDKTWRPMPGQGRMKLPRSARFIARHPGKVWRSQRPHVYCARCDKQVGPHWASYPSEVDRLRGIMYGRRRRLCRDCARIEQWLIDLVVSGGVVQ